MSEQFQQQLGSAVMEAYIRCFYPEKHFGYIEDVNTHESHFFHQADCPERFVPPIGTRVLYEFGMYKGRRKAINVRTKPQANRALDVLSGGGQ